MHQLFRKCITFILSFITKGYKAFYQYGSSNDILLLRKGF